MTQFTVYTQDTAPAASKELLGAVQSKYGFVPNLLATMAESPTALKAYLDLASTSSTGTLNPTEQQIVQITTSRENSCAYCVAAHSTVADMTKLPSDVINAVRDDKSIADKKLEALRLFTKAIVTKQGALSESETTAFLNAGYTNAAVLEVVLSVALKTFANYTHHLTNAPLDSAFQGRSIELQSMAKAS